MANQKKKSVKDKLSNFVDGARDIMERIPKGFEAAYDMAKAEVIALGTVYGVGLAMRSTALPLVQTIGRGVMDITASVANKLAFKVIPATARLIPGSRFLPVKAVAKFGSILPKIGLGLAAASIWTEVGVLSADLYKSLKGDRSATSRLLALEQQLRENPVKYIWDRLTAKSARSKVKSAFEQKKGN